MISVPPRDSARSILVHGNLRIELDGRIGVGHEDGLVAAVTALRLPSAGLVLQGYLQVISAGRQGRCVELCLVDVDAAAAHQGIEWLGRRRARALIEQRRDRKTRPYVGQYQSVLDERVGHDLACEPHEDPVVLRETGHDLGDISSPQCRAIVEHLGKDAEPLVVVEPSDVRWQVTVAAGGIFYGSCPVVPLVLYRQDEDAHHECGHGLVWSGVAVPSVDDYDCTIEI